MNTCSHDTPFSFSELLLTMVLRNNLGIAMVLSAEKTHAYKNECY